MADSSQIKINKPYFDNLDALRAIAALSVFVFHFSKDIQAFYSEIHMNKIWKVFSIFADKGNLGVSLFFVLSGFLITYLILDEIKRNGKFNLIKFLIRRCLRIWPLYFIIILIGFLIFPILFDQYQTNHDVWYYIFFLANFDEISNGINDSINFLTAPWSVAVEEQFYFFWALLFAVVPLKSNLSLNFIIGLLYLLSVAFCLFNWQDERTIYYHTLSVCQDILVGAFFANALFQNKKWLLYLINLKKIFVLIIYILGFTIIILKNKLFIDFGLVAERTVLAFFFAFIIIDQSKGVNSFIKFGKIKLLNFLGKISYGIYMYHLVVMFVLCRLIEIYLPTGYYLIPLYFVFSLFGVISVASISYYLIEKRFLKLKPEV